MAVDYEAWAVELSTLLDRIEMATGGNKLIERLQSCTYSMDEVETLLLSDYVVEAAHALDVARELCRQRFEIAEKHGFTVEFLGQPASGAEH